MYIIIVYDVEQKRVSKICKLLRKYLNWIQNSVFEGEITQGKFTELKSKMEKVIKKDIDSIIVFKIETSKWLNKEIIGKEFNSMDNLL